MQIQEQVSLAAYTTFQVGGPARWFAEAASEADVLSALEWARRQQLRMFVLGGGSNLLVDDAGYSGLVLRINLRSTTRQQSNGTDHVEYRAGAGEPWDHFVAATVANGDAGLECLSGIPGTTGGTPVQNVGAYGQETSQTLTRVRAVDVVTGGIAEFTAAECGFAYRASRFNGADRDRYILTRVDFALRHGGAARVDYADLKHWFAARDIDSPTLQQVREAVLAVRLGKGMVVEPAHEDMCSAGSFFKNPVVAAEQAELLRGNANGRLPPTYPGGAGRVKLSAAWLVENAGFSKGFSLGAAGVSTRHSLALVNRGGASCGDILRLKDAIVAGVRDRFGVTLQMEPVRLTADSGVVPPL